MKSVGPRAVVGAICGDVEDNEMTCIRHQKRLAYVM